MKVLFAIFFWLITGLTGQRLFAQQNFITNPGFEGPDGVEVIPEDWFAGCGVKNTPDTQPGWWNIELKPHEGKSYIDLLYKDDGTTESVYQELAEPLPAGSCFLIEIYLAKACQDSLSGLYPYDLNHPGDLVIRGSEFYGCGNGQVLAFFEQVSNCRWVKYQAVFQAETQINFIYLEFSRGSSPFANGSILIDDMSLDFLEPFPEQHLDFDYLQEVSLQASVEGSQFEWKADGMVLDSDSSTLTFLVTENVLIELSYWSEDSCLVFESFMVYVKPRVPNVITPTNNDGINDVFYIYGLIETNELDIINRWGETVFTKENYENNWSPADLTPGVYFYSLYLKDSNRRFHGFLTIL